MGKNKYTRIIFAITTSLAILSIMMYYYGFDIYTYLWHLTHTEPIKWNAFKITIPKELIARTIKNQQGYDEIAIYYFKDPDKAIILFERVDCHLKKDIDFNKTYKKAGFQIIEKNFLNILGNPCIWFKSFREGKKRIYKEDIIFQTEKILISFIGDKEKRHFLEELVNNLAWANSS